jgi:hypothetical protein
MSTHYACRGGASYYGDRCGHLLVNHTAYTLATDWNTGAALSFRLYRYTLSYA